MSELAVPHMMTNYSDRSFAVSGPAAWKVYQLHFD